MWYMLRYSPAGRARRSSDAGGFSKFTERTPHLGEARCRPMPRLQNQGSRTRIVMSETKNPSEKTLTVTPTKTLTLKRGGVEQGMVRQSFSHGRTKAVVVEKVKRRAVGPGEGKADR